MKKQFSGKVWKLGDDIDTDIIIPTQFLALESVEAMKKYAFHPLRPELAGMIEPGILLWQGKILVVVLLENKRQKYWQPLRLVASLPSLTREFFIGMPLIMACSFWKMMHYMILAQKGIRLTSNLEKVRFYLGTKNLK